MTSLHWLVVASIVLNTLGYVWMRREAYKASTLPYRERGES